jgi:hypothetical protein
MSKFPNKPMFACVAHTGKEYTIEFECTENCTGRSQGYGGIDVLLAKLQGLEIPIARYDLADFNDVLQSIKGEVTKPLGIYPKGQANCTFTDSIARLKNLNIPIQWTKRGGI